MPREQQAAILDPLRRLITRQTGSTLTDAQLLENFVSHGDEASFEVLVWRHGAMVLAVCKRVLRDAHEAEDAFQATFLVFAKKAGSIGRGEVVAAWLYKVAYRIAIRLRAAALKRGPARESTEEIAAPDRAGHADWSDLKPLLDDEIARLPEKYRAPFVLCYLEGRTNEEAAALLGCPKGTVLSRLSRGRERLRSRLTRRGVALSAAGFATLLTHNAALASLPSSLVPPTVGDAILFAAGTPAAKLIPPNIAALANGAMHAMTLLKIKIAASILALVMLGTGLSWAARSLEREGTLPSSEPGAAAAPQDRQRPAAGRPTLTGKVLTAAKDGKSFTVETPPTERGEEPGKANIIFGEKANVTYNNIGPDGAKPTEGYMAQIWFEENSMNLAATVIFTGGDAARRVGDAHGTVTDVAKDGKSFTLEINLRPERKQQTIPIDDKTVLAFNGVRKGEAAITKGYSATVWFADDEKTAAKVQFGGAFEAQRREEKRPDVSGKIMRAAEDGKTLVIEAQPTARGEEGARLTIKIPETATEVFNQVGRDGTKAAPEMQVLVWLEEGSKDSAAQIFFTGQIPERWTFLSGKISAVANDGKSFTLELPPSARGEEPKRIDIKLTEKTRQTYNRVGTGEAKPTVGLAVQVRLLEGFRDSAAQVVFGKPVERGQ